MIAAIQNNSRFIAYDDDWFYFKSDNTQHQSGDVLYMKFPLITQTLWLKFFSTIYELYSEQEKLQMLLRSGYYYNSIQNSIRNNEDHPNNLKRLSDALIRSIQDAYNLKISKYTQYIADYESQMKDQLIDIDSRDHIQYINNRDHIKMYEQEKHLIEKDIDFVFNAIQSSKRNLIVIAYSQEINLYNFYQTNRHTIFINVTNQAFYQFEISIKTIVLYFIEGLTDINDPEIIDGMRLKQNGFNGEFEAWSPTKKITLTMIQVVECIIKLFKLSIIDNQNRNYNSVIRTLLDYIGQSADNELKTRLISYFKLMKITIELAIQLKQKANAHPMNFELQMYNSKLAINFKLTCNNQTIETDNLIDPIDHTRSSLSSNRSITQEDKTSNNRAPNRYSKSWLTYYLIFCVIVFVIFNVILYQYYG